MNRTTGAPLSGWPHVEQSIAVILTTPIGSRVMRREFGSELPELIDRPMNSETILAVYAATAQALARWEPRYALTGVEVVGTGETGTLGLRLRGDYDGQSYDMEVSIA